MDTILFLAQHVMVNESLFDISISFANKIYAASNVILVLGAIMALLGTIGKNKNRNLRL